MRNSLFGIVRRFESFDKVDSNFLEHIQTLLNFFTLNPAPILFKMNIKKPVHWFNRPFHSCMMQQFFCCKLSAWNIVVPFAWSSFFVVNSVWIAPMHFRFIILFAAQAIVYPIIAWHMTDSELLLQKLAYSVTRCPLVYLFYIF